MEYIGEMKIIAQMLEARGFRLARGTYQPDGEPPIRTVVVTRPSVPEWQGIWRIIYEKEDCSGQSQGEETAALILAGEAILQWDSDVFLFLPNAKSERDGCLARGLRKQDS